MKLPKLATRIYSYSIRKKWQKAAQSVAFARSKGVRIIEFVHPKAN